MKDLITITDAAAASAFASTLRAKIVQTLIGEAMTLAELSHALGTRMSLLHYHVSKCVALGLVEVSHEQPRAGRALKHYRATARTFFVPVELLAKLPGSEMTRRLREALDRNQARAVEGVNFTHDGRNPCILLKRDSASASAAIELWLDVGLSAADAADLVEDLKAVLDRYRLRGDDGAHRYLVHVAAVPAEA
ncbi:MAG: helix-turn-helix domain-containing protein [Parvularculaceae bacterium]|nr:helix-turn-helix domain-containing protein [Parvularculaceae bacterium]